jgi:AcrR family transcriptional regulator
MSGNTNASRKTLRRQQTVEEIVDAAWALSQANGLGNFSMRELGERVGMRAQSLYSYFSSKHEIFDAMFAQGNRALIELMTTSVERGSSNVDHAEQIESMVHSYFGFCITDPVRYQLLFQRTIPNFVPSDESYSLAQQAYELAMSPLTDIDLTAADVDLFSGVMAGLVAQQVSNEPGGDRWERLIGRATRMLLNELAPELSPSSPNPSLPARSKA